MPTESLLFIVIGRVYILVKLVPLIICELILHQLLHNRGAYYAAIIKYYYWGYSVITLVFFLLRLQLQKSLKTVALKVDLLGLRLFCRVSDYGLSRHF